MIYIKRTFYLASILIFSLFVFALPQKRLDVEVCFTDDTFNCQFQPPKPLSTSLNINKITMTFKDVDIVIDSNSLRENAWGILFTSPAQDGGAAGEFLCSPNNCANGAITILANNEKIKVVTSEGSGVNRLVGTVVFTLSRFKEGKLPSQLQSLINSSQNGNLIVTATYLANESTYNPNNPPSSQPSGNPGTYFRSSPYFWGADIGTLINAPRLSVLSRFNGIVVNIIPPTNLSAVQQNEPNSDDGPSQLIPAIDGNISGYLLAIWKAQELDGTQPCSTSGLWNFVANPFTYNSMFKGSPPPPPVLACTYPPYVESITGSGGTSNILGCSFGVPASATPPYLSTNSDVPSLTPENVTVPAAFSSPSTKITTLQRFIKNPAVEFPVGGTCYSLVYIPVNQHSYGKMNIKNGEIFGFTAWTLNAAFTETDPTPNISLNHSNLSFMTGTVIELASTEKNPSLTLKTTDCFIATAASGDVNSKSVFYWRILRDEYLTRMGFTKYYTQYSPKLADWLNKHPKLKPSVNFILEKTGATLYFSTLYTRKGFDWIKEHTKFIQKKIKDLFVQEAAAEEKDDFRFVSYDLGIVGGVLFPTSDKNLYKKYYPKPTTDIAISSNAIFWTHNIGWSLGLKGDYAFNSARTTQTTVGPSTQQNKRTLNFLSLEIIGGARYRNLKFLFVQPSVFAGAGILKIREEGGPVDDTGQNGSREKNQTFGVTYYSPVFDLGGNLDISLSALFFYPKRELVYEKDVLLRLSAIYRVNPSKALSMTGLILNAGFAFIF